MNVRQLGHVLVAGIAITVGCRTRPPAAGGSPGAPPQSEDVPGDTLVHVHWLGKNRIAADTNSTTLMSVWNLPESAQLESQTLDKLSLASRSLLHRPVAIDIKALLRPLWEDVLRQESFLEIRQVTTNPPQTVFAIRLDESHAGLWRTNLALVLEALTGIPTTPAGGSQKGWTLKKHHLPDLIQLDQVDDWILIGAAHGRNRLLEELSGRIQQDRRPFAQETTNLWLEADLDLPRVASAFSFNWNLPSDFPRISLKESGEGTNLHTQAGLEFPHSLLFAPEPWTIPTNLLHEPITSFTAVRGFKPWLASLKTWTNLQIGPPPNQFFVWSEPGQPMLTYFAAPLADASNRVHRISDIVLQASGRKFGTNSDFGFARAQDSNGIEWRGLPFLWPYFRADVGQHEFATGGLFPSAESPDWPPPELPQNILSKSNLLYYGWELSGPRVDAWLYISQFFRHVTGHPQLEAESAGLKWLRAISPRLGKCVTRITLNRSNQISFERESTLGFSGAELQLLVDWFESPEFPKGLHTLTASPTAP